MDVTHLNKELSVLINQLGKRLVAAQWLLSTAESCTGGLVAASITALPSSGDWFDRGFVTYSIVSKTEMLGVPPDLVKKYGAVSEPVACAMAKGALQNSHAHIALSITGIAGPTDAGEGKPIGTVCFGWSCGDQIRCATMQFTGNRQKVRLKAVRYGLQGVLNIIENRDSEA